MAASTPNATPAPPIVALPRDGRAVDALMPELSVNALGTVEPLGSDERAVAPRDVDDARRKDTIGSRRDLFSYGRHRARLAIGRGVAKGPMGAFLLRQASRWFFERAP